MNPDYSPRRPLYPAVLAIIGTFLIVAVLVLALRRHEPPALDAARKAERAKVLAELRQGEAQALAKPAWINKEKGIVRLPVDVAMNTVLQMWQNPETAKAELVQRVQKATEVPPPPPAKPSEFE